MRWQQSLTKGQLQHLRWSRDGQAPTLRSFKVLREHQAGLKRQREASGLYSSLCPVCDQVEARLKEKGNLK